MADAVVIGAGPNGLVAANMLVDEGWDVVVLEAQPEPGGAVRSAELTEPGFAHDLFSSFYPLGAASPWLHALGLEEHGLRWRHAPVVLAHPTPDGRCAVLSRDIDETAASLDDYAPGDGDSWRQKQELWDRVGDHFVNALLRPFPPVTPALRLLGALKPSEVLRFARMALLPVRRMGEELFEGEGGRLLLAGNALHADLAPETSGSGIFGWLLTALGQQRGFPVPEGGAGALTAALVRRFEHKGGKLHTDAAVTAIDVVNGRATGVRTRGGMTVAADRAMLADVGAPALYRDLLPSEAVPARTMHDLKNFQYDNGTVKVDWAIDGEIPWTAAAAKRAGTVHLADSVNHLTQVSAELAQGAIPPHPFLLVGQMHVADPTRSPPGTGTVWAYTHVPFAAAVDTEAYADVIESVIERYAPGFKDTVRARHVMGPHDLEARDANLVGGAINGGTAALYQQLVFRPTPGMAGPRTPVENLYLASASAHPGGGVHGACGANAALAALKRKALSARR
jgi:phytoene dehydrogenase-like protein